MAGLNSKLVLDIKASRKSLTALKNDIADTLSKINAGKHIQKSLKIDPVLKQYDLLSDKQNFFIGRARELRKIYGEIRSDLKAVNNLSKERKSGSGRKKSSGGTTKPKPPKKPEVVNKKDLDFLKAYNDAINKIDISTSRLRAGTGDVVKEQKKIADVRRQMSTAIDGYILGYDTITNKAGEEEVIEKKILINNKQRLKVETKLLPILERKARIANEAVGRVRRGGKRAGGGPDSFESLLNISRIIQDAPFGILGIANNLDMTLASMQKLNFATKGWGATFKQIGRDIFRSQMGYLVILNTITSIIVGWDGISSGIKKAIKWIRGANKELESTKENIEEAKKSALNFNKLNREEITKTKETAITNFAELEKQIANYKGEIKLANYQLALGNLTTEETIENVDKLNEAIKNMKPLQKQADFINEYFSDIDKVFLKFSEKGIALLQASLQGLNNNYFLELEDKLRDSGEVLLSIQKEFGELSVDQEIDILNKKRDKRIDSINEEINESKSLRGQLFNYMINNYSRLTDEQRTNISIIQNKMSTNEFNLSRQVKEIRKGTKKAATKLRKEDLDEAKELAKNKLAILRQIQDAQSESISSRLALLTDGFTKELFLENERYRLFRQSKKREIADFEGSEKQKRIFAAKINEQLEIGQADHAKKIQKITSDARQKDIDDTLSVFQLRITLLKKENEATVDGTAKSIKNLRLGLESFIAEKQAEIDKINEKVDKNSTDEERLSLLRQMIVAEKALTDVNINRILTQKNERDRNLVDSLAEDVRLSMNLLETMKASERGFFETIESEKNRSSRLLQLSHENDAILLEKERLRKEKSAIRIENERERSEALLNIERWYHNKSLALEKQFNNNKIELNRQFLKDSVNKSIALLKQSASLMSQYASLDFDIFSAKRKNQLKELGYSETEINRIIQEEGSKRLKRKRRFAKQEIAISTLQASMEAFKSVMELPVPFYVKFPLALSMAGLVTAIGIKKQQQVDGGSLSASGVSGSGVNAQTRAPGAVDKNNILFDTRYDLFNSARDISGLNAARENAAISNQISKLVSVIEESNRKPSIAILESPKTAADIVDVGIIYNEARNR